MDKVTYHHLRKRYEDALRHILSHDKQAISAFHLEQANAHLDYSATKLKVLSGISGVGKTTIGKTLEARYNYKKLRNVYSRPMRPNESDQDGIFIDITTFKDWAQKDLFLTKSITNGAAHGLLKSEVNLLHDSDDVFWADKSVSSMKALWNDVQGVAGLYYALPPDFKTLYERLAARESGASKTLDTDAILQRFEEEFDELKKSMSLPYKYIVNDHIERVVALIEPEN